METYLIQITDYLLTQSWQIAVLVAVVAAANFALRNKSAHVRYLLWLIVLAKCLVPPLMTVPVAVLPQDEPAPVIEIAAMPEVEPLTLPSRPAPPTPAQTVATRPARLSPRQWIGLTWIVGVAAFILVAVTKALRTQLWLRRKRKPLPADSQIGIEGLFTGLELKRLPKVWFVEGIGQPFVWGLLRGGIYLPANFVKVNNDEHRRDIFGHELSHILRFDAAINLLQIISQSVFWFHPFVWWTNKKIRAEREKCCDEMTIASLNAPVRDYSRAIVETLITEHESTRPIPSLAVAGPVKNIEERIKTMLRPGKKFYRHPSVPALAIVILIALLAVPTTITLTARADDKAMATNLGPTFNSQYSECWPSISADGLEIYFHTARPGGQGNGDLWVTKRATKQDEWNKPVNLGSVVNSSSYEWSPCISFDGLELYFSSDRPGGSGRHDIWVTRRPTKNDAWGEPVNLGPTINGPTGDTGPSLSTDGLNLYFDSYERTDGYGGFDILVAKRASRDEPWGTPVPLPPPLNTSGFEAEPDISRDGLTLFFMSERPGGVGDRDIWMATRATKDDPWGAPKNLGPTVNSPENDAGPNVSADGLTLYFNSKRPGGFGRQDLYEVSLKSYKAKGEENER